MTIASCILSRYHIGIIDKATGKWVWKYWHPAMGGQHDLQMLENGNILLFNNAPSAGHSECFPAHR